MNSIFLFLLCVVFIVLITRPSDTDVHNNPRVLASVVGNLERNNLTYFYIHYHGPIIVNLKSLMGDADLYISDTNMFPTYEPDFYSLHSATCGEDMIEVPESFETPVAVGVYGYVESSVFLLEVFENTKISYSLKPWVHIEKDIENFTEDKGKSGGSAKKSNGQTQKKKKKSKENGTTIPSILSVLEVLQLVFL